MSFINLEQLPFVGMSYEFVGATQGAPFSAYIVKAKPGQGPPLHKHPYVEDKLVTPALPGTSLPRRSLGIGGRQIDIHASSRFIQTNFT